MKQIWEKPQKSLYLSPTEIRNLFYKGDLVQVAAIQNHNNIKQAHERQSLMDMSVFCLKRCFTEVCQPLGGVQMVTTQQSFRDEHILVLLPTNHQLNAEYAEVSETVAFEIKRGEAWST